MKREAIRVDLLLLSEDNPRIDPTFGEDDSIKSIIDDQKNKLCVLAEDIVQYGLNPLDTIGVYPSESYEGYYTVAEGNRRVCVIKLLSNPEKLNELGPQLYNKFKILSEEYRNQEIIEVIVFDKAEEIQHWMEVRHLGEQEGRGIANWNSIQKARFGKILGKQSLLLDFWDYMIENGVLSSEQIKDVTKTNWERILRDKYFPFLRIEKRDRYIVNECNIEQFTERIRAIQRNLANKSVGIVYDEPKIDEFYNRVSMELYNLPFQSVINKESEQMNMDEFINSPDEAKMGNSFAEQAMQETILEKDNFKVNNKEEKKVSGVSNTTVVLDVFNNSSTIIPIKYKLQTSNMRLNKIINELKRLNPDEYPNACGGLLRLLFELSAKYYLEKETGNDQTETEFQQAIRGAANQLRSQNRLLNDQHSSIIKDVDSLRLIFNGYMHNTDGYPNGMALKNFFKAHKVFIEECLK